MRFDGRFKRRVVQRVENTQDVNAVGNGLLHKILDGVVRVMAVAQHVLAAEQHLQQFGISLRAGGGPTVLVQKRMQESNVSRCPALLAQSTSSIAG